MENNQYNPPRLTEDEIVSIIERNVPDFAKACEVQEAEVIMMTQSAWAVDYLLGEFTLLGLAIKYAGIKGKQVMIIPQTTE